MTRKPWSAWQPSLDEQRYAAESVRVPEEPEEPKSAKKPIVEALSCLLADYSDAELGDWLRRAFVDGFDEGLKDGDA